jgi:hypothetical protein
MNYTEVEKEHICKKHIIEKKIAKLLSCYELETG